jgi:hypothetical protein
LPWEWSGEYDGKAVCDRGRRLVVEAHPLWSTPLPVCCQATLCARPAQMQHMSCDARKARQPHHPLRCGGLLGCFCAVYLPRQAPRCCIGWNCSCVAEVLAPGAWMHSTCYVFAPQSSLAPADKAVYESEEDKRSEAIRHIEWLVVCSCCAWSCRPSLGRMCLRFWLGMQRGCLCSWPGRPVQAGFVTLPWSLPLSVVRHTDRVHEPPKGFCCLIVSHWCIRG